jgi:hypothetical protein
VRDMARCEAGKVREWLGADMARCEAGKVREWLGADMARCGIWLGAGYG